MTDWDEVHKAIFPIKIYDDLSHRLLGSFGYRFIQEAYNFPLPRLEEYTRRLLGGDERGRYESYCSKLTTILKKLSQAGVEDVLSLVEQTARRQQLECLADKAEIPAQEIAILLKYLVYWVVPTEKYLGSLVREEQSIHESILALRTLGIRTNLDILQAGITAQEQQALADRSNVSLDVISDLVNRADFSRLPWASKATISNIIGAGYGSIEQLVEANLDQLVADFFRYGQLIGKNLKFGNEIESSYRIAGIMPVVLLDGR